MERGKFITVEGVDGAGKSTQFEVIANALKEKGIDFVSTREPGGPESAEPVNGFSATASRMLLSPTKGTAVGAA